MKKLFVVLTVVLSIFLLVGCLPNKNSDSVTMQAPKNLKFNLEGVWDLQGYKVLDTNIGNNDYVHEVLANPIKLTNSNVNIGGRIYEGVSYKLKYVNADYKLSYEANVNLSSLGIDFDNIEVYSVTNDNNLLCEIIYTGVQKSYLYYQGILFTITYNKKERNTVVASKNTVLKDKIKKSSQGLLLGLKTMSSNENGEYQSENYRTLWISTRSGELQGIKEKQNIVFPRRSGIWELKKHIFTDNGKGIYYEYFKARSVDSVLQEDTNIENGSIFSTGKVIKQQINYVGSDYIATEIFTNERFSESPVYRVLPVDNLLAHDGVTISDLYGLQANSEFEQDYRNTYVKINNENRSKLSKDIDYSNFTIARNNGEWALQGRISPILAGGEAINFQLNQKVSKPLNSNNTLLIPWKILKGSIPLLVDAFSSPDGSISIIVTNNELIIYRIEDGRLGKEPLTKVSLRSGERVIMAEWCESDYMNKWSSAFSNGATIIG